MSRQKDREDELTSERLTMDDRTLLAAIGEALYGQSWKVALAGDLNADAPGPIAIWHLWLPTPVDGCCSMEKT